MNSENRIRKLYVEILESRDLLAISVVEFEAIRSAYPELQLHEELSRYHVVEIAPEDRTAQSLKEALEQAANSPEDDLILLRTDGENAPLFLGEEKILIDYDWETFGDLFLIGWGESPLEIAVPSIPESESPNASHCSIRVQRGKVDFVNIAFSGFCSENLTDQRRVFLQSDYRDAFVEFHDVVLRDASGNVLDPDFSFYESQLEVERVEPGDSGFSGPFEPVPFSYFSSPEIVAANSPGGTNYAVLFAGGVNVDTNYFYYYDVIKYLYEMLRDEFSLPVNNIYVVYADGNDPGIDQNFDGSYVNSDMSFAASNRVFAATKNNLDLVLKSVGERMNDEDHLLFFSYDHGSNLSDKSSPTLCVWGNQHISGPEVADSLFQISRGYVATVMSQCYSGGILDDIFDLNTGHSRNPNISSSDAANKWYAMAATNFYETSWTLPNAGNRKSTGFAQSFLAGLDPNRGNTTFTWDVFSYAKSNDPFAVSYSYPKNGGSEVEKKEHPWEIGANFSIFTTSTAKPDIAPIVPSNWSDSIIVSTSSGSRTDAPELLSTDTIYVNFAFTNSGGTDIPGPFRSSITIAGGDLAQPITFSQTEQRLLVGEQVYLPAAYYLGRLGAGTYTITVQLDSDSAIEESNEYNNIYSKRFTVKSVSSDIGDTLNSSQLVEFSDGIFSAVQKIGDGIHGDRDVDIFRITIREEDLGHSLRIETSLPEGNGFSPLDTYLRLFNSSGTQIAFNDDKEGGMYSMLVFTPAQPGTYYIGVSAYENRTYNPALSASGSRGSLGDYELNVQWITSARADLASYFHPDWGNSILLSNRSAGGTSTMQFTTEDTVFFNYAFSNIGEIGISAPFTNRIVISGEHLSRAIEFDLLPSLPLSIGEVRVLEKHFELGKLPAGNYTISVILDCENKIEELSESDNVYFREFSVASIPLSTPQWDSITVLSDSTISLSWKPVENASSYSVQISTDPAFANESEIETRTSIPGITFTATELQGDTWYYFRVKASGSGFADSGFSGVISSKTFPASLDIGDTLSDAMEIRFDAKNLFIHSERIGNGFYADRDVDLFELEILPGDLGCAYRFTTSRNGDAPIFDTYLRLFDAMGEEWDCNDDASEGQNPYSEIVFIPTTPGLYYIGVSSYENSDYFPQEVNSGVPGEQGEYTLTVSKNEYGKLESPQWNGISRDSFAIDFSWDPVENAASYVLECSLDLFFGEGVPIREFSGIEDCSLRITDLEPDTIYYVRLKAVGEFAWDSDFSEVRQVQILPLQRGEITVSNANPGGPGSFRAALEDIPEGGTISFAPELEGCTITLQDNLLINKSITVDASFLTRFTICGTGNSGIFTVLGPETQQVVFRGFTISSGNSYDGGAFVIYGGDTLLEEMNLERNSALWGGAIYHRGGNLTLSGSSFTENNASGYDGGAIYQSGGRIRIENCTFSGNSAAKGGAIAQNGGHLILTNCTITENDADQGGGIHQSERSGGFLEIYNTILAGNSSDISCVEDRSFGKNNLIGILGNSLSSFSENNGNLIGTVSEPINPRFAEKNRDEKGKVYYPLGESSPAIHAGDDTFVVSLEQDQLFRPRIVGESVDLGAVEFTGTVPVWNSFFENPQNLTNRFAVGDLDGDGIPELVRIPNPGEIPEIRVFSGIDGHELQEYYIPPSVIFGWGFQESFSVAIGDVCGNAGNDLVLTPTKGSSVVLVFENTTNRSIGHFGWNLQNRREFNAFEDRKDHLEGASLTTASGGNFQNKDYGANKDCIVLQSNRDGEFLLRVFDVSGIGSYHEPVYEIRENQVRDIEIDPVFASEENSPLSDHPKNSDKKAEILRESEIGNGKTEEDLEMEITISMEDQKDSAISRNFTSLIEFLQDSNKFRRDNELRDPFSISFTPLRYSEQEKWIIRYTTFEFGNDSLPDWFSKNVVSDSQNIYLEDDFSLFSSIPEEESSHLSQKRREGNTERKHHRKGGSEGGTPPQLADRALLIHYVF